MKGSRHLKFSRDGMVCFFFYGKNGEEIRSCRTMAFGSQNFIFYNSLCNSHLLYLMLI